MKRESKRHVQVNEQETNWGGFLVDKDAEPLTDCFRSSKLATKRPDPEIVAEAWEEGRTIITSNGRHFVWHIEEFQKRSDNQACRDLWGLVIVPNHAFLREKMLPKIRNGLLVPRLGTLAWPAVAYLNLRVRITDADLDIRRFKRCPFCEKERFSSLIENSWRTWYYQLPIVCEPPGQSSKD